MIMAAPLPSGVLQNEHIFLPLTDLDYRKHHLKASNTDWHTAQGSCGVKKHFEDNKDMETHGNGWVVWFKSVVLKWFCFTSPREHQHSQQNVNKNVLWCSHISKFLCYLEFVSFYYAAIFNLPVENHCFRVFAEQWKCPFSKEYLFRDGARGSGSGSGVAADGDQDCLRELMDWDDGRVADPGRPLWYDEEPESDEWGRL